MDDVTEVRRGAVKPAESNSPWAVHLLSLAAGSAIAVGVIYLPQTLLAAMAADYHVTNSAAGILPTAVQVGYALGIFLLVPLADRIAPRRQVTTQSVLLAAALLLTAAMPGVVAAAAGFAIVGLVANIAQIIISTSAKLAPPGAAGSTVATIVGSLAVGIFGGRILAGLLVGTVGWRWVLVVFAALVLCVLPALRGALAPAQASPGPTAYGRLLQSTLNAVRRSRTTAESVILQFFVFAAFNALWAAMVLHLTGSRHGWSSSHAGLFGVVGLAASLTSPIVFRTLKGLSELKIAGIFLLVFFLAMSSIVFDADDIPLFAVSAFLATSANQFIQTAAQRRVLEANGEHPAAANAAFMVGVFAGGAAGSFTGVAVFTAGGMKSVGVLGALLIACGSVVWRLAVQRERQENGASGPLGHTP
ncbi:putative MFS family arabinose efflux permease [Streptomyces aurantiacus]|uniref:MFS transporter n=1 Tax=Streptomyces aurantiacus TaxID=47760 RepID=UPI002790812A|nr:MFS transporter [Streptomyces aurantiacus]MDQ0771741.1 putative MFS family arabinose efflux permease [Streptomyces aurantiacus]